MSFSEAQKKALALCPKLSGGLSFFFSLLIVTSVLSNKKKRSSIYHRILLGISIIDASSSFWFGLSTWPIPRESGAMWAVGTQQTCNLQGFFTQLPTANPMYNASLSIFYLLVIRYGWRNSQIRKFEPWFHIVPLVWGISTATAALFLKLYNNANFWCWIAPNPQDASRGKHADVYRMIFSYSMIWGSILVVTVNMILIYLAVHKVEVNAEQHRSAEKQFCSSDDVCIIGSTDGASSRASDASVELPKTKIGSSRDVEDVEASTNVHEQHHDDSFSPKAQETSSAIVYDPESNKEEPPKTTCSPDSDSGYQAADSVRVATRASHTRSATCRSTTFSTGPRLPSVVSRRGAGFSTKRTREVARQCFLYAAAFYINWVPLSIIRFSQLAGVTSIPFGLLLVASIATPLQGLPNFCVYIFPRFRQVYKQHPKLCLVQALQKSLFTDATD